ncbi:MAG: AgmX/PglI C-terminal domain-containing protein [Myxococcota bacterium]|nr:AgmX/PglI C-terminal domain-containing protein [Myxococcota bacterium]
MASCPFCNGSVSDELARLGGNCPNCFNLIPGEEAATDPGVEAQQAEAQAEASQERKQSAGRIGILLALLVAAGGAGGWFWYQGQLEEERIAAALAEEVEADFFMLDADEIETITADSEPEKPVAVASAGGTKPKGGNRPPPPEEDAGAFGAGSDRFADEGSGGVAKSASDGPSLSTTSMGVPSVSGGPSIGVSRKDVVLTDPAEIQAMVGGALKRYSGQIKTCYENELKANPSLKGVWQITFVVNPDGSTSQVVVKAQGASDAGLESCMKRQVSQWSFQKISRAQPFGKKYRFGAS